ncbi:hypothetical protein BDV97DRAFT_232881 [Delphinella strobiligena]|nr:hypothetical protein BDV97DRAFT_232881 [Delphinella strobiligena]
MIVLLQVVSGWTALSSVLSLFRAIRPMDSTVSCFPHVGLYEVDSMSSVCTSRTGHDLQHVHTVSGGMQSTFKCREAPRIVPRRKHALNVTVPERLIRTRR